MKRGYWLMITNYTRIFGVLPIILGLAGGTHAQEAELPEVPWTKLCSAKSENDKQVCQVSRNLLSPGGQLLTSVAVRETEGEARKTLMLMVPPGMLIQPGLRTQIDSGKQQEAKYSICFSNGCFSDMVIDDAFIASMKKGNRLVITTLNQAGKPAAFPVSLLGFTAAYDGPPIESEEQLQEINRQVEEQIKERADKARQALIDRQNELSQQ